MHIIYIYIYIKLPLTLVQYSSVSGRVVHRRGRARRVVVSVAVSRDFIECKVSNISFI